MPREKSFEKKKMPTWKKVSLWLVAIFTVGILSYIGYIVYYFTYSGSAQELVVIADKLKPDPSWELRDESIETPKHFCGDTICPRVYRSWKIERQYTDEDLEQIVSRAGWDFPVDGTCEINPNVFGSPLPLCRAEGVVDGYQVSVAISGSSSQESQYISISVKEKEDN